MFIRFIELRFCGCCHPSVRSILIFSIKQGRIRISSKNISKGQNNIKINNRRLLVRGIITKYLRHLSCKGAEIIMFATKHFRLTEGQKGVWTFEIKVCLKSL